MLNHRGSNYSNSKGSKYNNSRKSMKEGKRKIKRNGRIMDDSRCFSTYQYHPEPENHRDVTIYKSN